MSDKVKQYINDLFVELNEEVTDIVNSSSSPSMATQEIMEYVSVKIASSSKSYVVDLYSELSRNTLKEPIFEDAANANKFYELNLRKQIGDAYRFDVKDLEAYNAGIDFNEINRLYASAGAAVGSAAVGGILLGVISGVVKLPMVVIIAGAVLAGLTGGGVAYTKVIPEKNKSTYLMRVTEFMNELEDELLNWVDEVVKFYNRQVEDLKKTL